MQSADLGTEPQNGAGTDQGDACSGNGLRVLALRTLREGESCTPTDIEAMLALFGPVCCVQSLDSHAGAPVSAHVFEFGNTAHAQQAVQAVGNRAGSMFTLHLLSEPGSGGAAPQRQPAPPPPVPPPPHYQPHLPPPPASNPSSSTLPSYQQSSMRSTHCGTSTSPQSTEPMPPSHPHFGTRHSHYTSSVPFHPELAPGPGRAVTSASCPMQGAYPRHMQPFINFNHPKPPPPHGGICNIAGPILPPHDGGGGGANVHDFDPAEAAAGGPNARTTVMVRHIPCRWTAHDLLSALAPAIGNAWDLLYMPCKTLEVANSGYAFINLESSAVALRLYNAMQNKHWPNTRSCKLCEVRYARIQGLALLEHLLSSSRQSRNVFRGYLAFFQHGELVVRSPDCAGRGGAAAGTRGVGGGGGSTRDVLQRLLSERTALAAARASGRSSVPVQLAQPMGFSTHTHGSSMDASGTITQDAPSPDKAEHSFSQALHISRTPPLWPGANPDAHEPYAPPSGAGLASLRMQSRSPGTGSMGSSQAQERPSHNAENTWHPLQTQEWSSGAQMNDGNSSARAPGSTGELLDMLRNLRFSTA